MSQSERIDAMLAQPSASQIAQDFGAKASDDSTVEGVNQWSLAYASVVRVDYETFQVDLRIENGEQKEPHPTSLNFPGAGTRHFLGAMPMVGDVCVVGFRSLESGHSRTPVILSWFLPGTTAGHDWMPKQPFAPEEFAMRHADRKRIEGIANRHRHKLRHMQPGDIMASSGRGSDLVLDASATLSNRRGNEVRLRDQDQAIVFRSLQQFHATAGVRVYTGMVQRDAAMLPTQMFSDAIDWDSALQVDGSRDPLTESELESDGLTRGALTAAKVFDADETGLRSNGVTTIPEHLNPAKFLYRGLFVSKTGNRKDARVTPTAVYGGKAILRVGEAPYYFNSAMKSDAPALTEHRIEVTHTSDGILPVTEQTDGFDADRLPDTVPTETAPQGGSGNAPFLQVVYGSVVGNDPFTQTGRTLYAHPLRPVIFDGDERAPALVSGRTDKTVGGHAASLFRMKPPDGLGGAPTWWSTTKDGRVKASIAGPGNVWSMEGSVLSGIRMGLGAEASGISFRMDASGAVSIISEKGDNARNIGVEIASTTGAVRIYGGGSLQEGGLTARLGDSASGGESALPGLILEGATNVLIKAGRSVVISATDLNLKDISNLGLSANANLNLSSGDKVTTTGKVIETTAMGRMVTTISGPKDSKPTNTPLRETSFTATPATGLVGGVVDKYKVAMGDREEVFTKGDHSTTVRIGNQTYACNAGEWKATSGVGSVNTIASHVTRGIRAEAAVGNVKLTASTGQATLKGTVSAEVSSQGVSTVKGASVILKSTVGTKTGGIVSAADLDPLSGLPLATYGMGSPTHLLSVGA